MKDHCCSQMRDSIKDPNCAIKYDPVYREYYTQTVVDGDAFVKLYKDYQLPNYSYTYGQSSRDFFIQFLDREFYDKEGNNILKVGWVDSIEWCPFCGKKLPKVLEIEWQYTIDMDYGYEYEPGYEYNWKNDRIDKTLNPPPKPLPEEFKSDKWWKDRRLNTKQGWKDWVKRFNKWKEDTPWAAGWGQMYKEQC